MTDKITMMKDRVLDYMDQEIGKYGNNRMDVKQMGDLADIIKDLAEAEYYCSVSNAMGDQQPQGYTQPMGDRMGYGGGDMGRSGYGGGSGTMGHTDPIAMVRDMLASANPDMRSQIRSSLGI